MDTITIKRLLKTYKCFKGVFPCDRLPYDSVSPLNIIVNTDPSYKPGQHWVCVSINQKGRGYYFDSFGLPPIVPEIRNFLDQKTTKGWTYNKRKIQNITSSTCGNYCILFILFKCNKISLKDFIGQFGRSSKKNDDKMRKIFRNFSLLKRFFKK